ncbi:ABC transporter ATP-binding protein [bacterium]|nr:ABC transporter ATP-binding protein [bacterium]
MHIIKLNNVSKSYLEDKKKLQVLKSINLTVEEGEFVAITGTSGCGKSTLLHLIGLLDSPDSGEINLAGESCNSISNMEIFRNRNIGFIFQFHYLLDDFTALENVMIPLLVQGYKKAEAVKLASEVIISLGIGQRMHHFPNQLSGGEEQRIAIARAIVTKPKILLADEPSGNLDEETTQNVISILRDLNKKGLTIIFVTHDLNLVKEDDSHYTIKEGKLIQA